VAAHIFYLSDAKELLRSGIDILAHLPRDRDVDDELMTAFQTASQRLRHDDLPDRETTEADLAFRGAKPLPRPGSNRCARLWRRSRPLAPKTARETYGIQARNLARLNAAGVKIVFGTTPVRMSAGTPIRS